jgi:gamma-glutamyltranspeptidase/glutathione hydrolase
MAPTIVSRDGDLFMVVGSPGGSTIPTTILQVISNVVDFGMSLEDAVAAGRVHNQYLPDKISIEAEALAASVVEALRAAGYTVEEREPIGDVQAILADTNANGRGVAPKGLPNGRLRGVSDTRGNGRAIGY